LNPEYQVVQNRKGYRSQARPKQLPPDTVEWYKLLESTTDSKLGIPNLEMVSIVTDLRGRKPVTKTLSSIGATEAQAWLTSFFLWFIQAGRGFGKSWTGSSWINEGAENATGEYMAIMGRDAHDVRAYCVEGDSGILRTARNDFYPKYEPSKRLITWPNGVKAQIFYAEEPNTVRGPNNFRAWADEPASYQDAALGLGGDNGEDTAFSNLLMTLRIGHPQLLVTGTPKPLKLVRDLLATVGCIVVRGGSRENQDNLAPVWFKQMEDKYAGTRLGKQELDGDLLDDNPGALWRREWIEKARVRLEDVPQQERVVVGVDPSASSTASSAEAGIITAGRWWHPGEERYHYYVLDDDSMRGSPNEWAKASLGAYSRHRADRIVAERNNGGEMVELTIRNCDRSGSAAVSTVWASRGKVTRAEPISALYEQGRVHHVGDPKKFDDLEDQQCTWEPGLDSPDRLDALVWAITELSDSGRTEESSEDHDNFWESDDEY